MKPETKAFIFEQAGKLLSGGIRVFANKPKYTDESETPAPELSKPSTSSPPAFIPVETTAKQPSPEFTLVKPAVPTDATKELDYRFECCMKHLGAASVLLREAYERSLDEGIGEGTGEKIMEAMNEHAGMEEDLEKMLNLSDAKPIAERLMSGVRQFRAAAWKSRLPTGGGTKQDLEDARLWNDILLQEAYTNAKKHPGTECIAEGM